MSGIRRRRRLVSRLMALSWGLSSALGAAGNPLNPNVAHGAAQFHADHDLLQISNSPGAIINWQAFGIAAHEVTRFVQQGAHSAVLNRVTGGDPSAILGRLLSNGRVFLINPNGIVFGPNAVIDTAGLVASTLDMTDADFLAGRLHFEDKGGAGAIVNQGYVKAAPGGHIVLVAPDIENSGVLQADGGRLLLAAGRGVTIASLDDPSVTFEIQAPDNQVVNLGELLAENGAAAVFAGSIEHSGVIRADSVGVDGQGRVILAAQDRVEVGGSVDANGPRGGEIRIDSELGAAWVGGAISAAGSELTGGRVEVTAPDVTLTGSVDVSGAAGGGQAYVGGGLRGADPTIRNATHTTFARGAHIEADATVQGDGGEVIVWADDTTRAYGSVSARGAGGGDGGFAEISGKRNLRFRADVDLLADDGNPGTLLLDPDDLAIVDGAGTIGNLDGELPDVLEQDLAEINEVSEQALEAVAGNVLLAANNTITVENISDNLIDMGGASSLTLRTSFGNITFNDANDAIRVGGDIDLSAGGELLDIGGLESTGTITLGAELGARITTGTRTWTAPVLSISPSLTITGGTLIIDGAASVAQLDLTAGELAMAVNQSLTVTGSGTWSDSLVSGPGALRIGAAVTLDIMTTGTDKALSADLINDGSVNFNVGGGINNVDTLLVASGASIVNNGTMVLAGDILGSGALENHGTMLCCSAFAGSTDLAFVNTGLLENTLTGWSYVFGGGGSHAGAQILLTNGNGFSFEGNHSFDAATSISGQRAMRFVGGTHVIDGSYQLASPGQTVVSQGANVTFNSDAVFGVTLDVTGVPTSFVNLNGNTYSLVPLGQQLAINSGSHITGSLVTLNGATFDVSGTQDQMIANGGGGLVGNGTLIGDLTLDIGGVIPGGGGGIGTITIDGNYNQMGNSQLTVELAGTTPDTGHDRLIVTGVATLDDLNSSLVVLLNGGFTPTAGDTFDVLDAQGGIQGTFGSVTQPENFAAPAIGANLVQLMFLGNTVFFDNSLGNFLWNEPLNWSNDMLPAFDRDVVLDFGGQPVILDGADVVVASLTANDELRLLGGSLTVQGDANLLSGFVQSGGVSSFEGSTAVGALSLSGGLLAGAGSLTVSGPASFSGGTVDRSGALTVTGAATLAGGGIDSTVSLAGPAQWLGGTVSGSGAVSITPGGSLAVSSTGSFAPLVTNQGSLIKSGTGTSTFSASVTNAGSVLIQGGALSVIGNYTQTGGATFLDNGQLISSGGVSLQGGRFGGIGSVQGDLDNIGAAVSPGASPGILSVTGDYFQGSNGTLLIEIAGATPGSGYDVLAVGGTAFLGGSLDVQFTGGFVPAPGTQFDILTYGSTSGDFASINTSTEVVISPDLGFYQLVFAPLPTQEPLIEQPQNDVLVLGGVIEEIVETGQQTQGLQSQIAEGGSGEEDAGEEDEDQPGICS